eukprot:TRINITY_DN8242_c0_g1_i1.p1 TRINITY_DN8242_c0_g1~~TRINITY_DN8242_c0_g1_i1.p1  ORF type:complete len:303 (-),score=42.79 TRINITY_DN8242_c0_g1_i1:53-961(-)
MERVGTVLLREGFSPVNAAARGGAGGSGGAGLDGGDAGPCNLYSQPAQAVQAAQPLCRWHGAVTTVARQLPPRLWRRRAHAPRVLHGARGAAKRAHCPRRMATAAPAVTAAAGDMDFVPFSCSLCECGGVFAVALAAPAQLHWLTAGYWRALRHARDACAPCPWRARATAAAALAQQLQAASACAKPGVLRHRVHRTTACSTCGSGGAGAGVFSSGMFGGDFLRYDQQRLRMFCSQRSCGALVGVCCMYGVHACGRVYIPLYPPAIIILLSGGGRQSVAQRNRAGLARRKAAALHVLSQNCC